MKKKRSDEDSDKETQSHLDIFNSYVPNIKSVIDTQHSIAVKVS